MAEEVKPKTTKPKAEKAEEKPVEEAKLGEMEIVQESKPNPVENESAVELDDSVEEAEVEAMGRRGRRSKSEVAEQNKRTKEDIESNYANMIAHEPAKADLFREELRIVLKNLGL